MTRKLNVLMLATDAHGGSGGIAQYNRNMLDALSLFDRIGSVTVVPRIIGAGELALPPKVSYDRAAARGIPAFLRAVCRQSLRRGQYDLVVCGHINLAPAAVLASKLLGVPAVLVIHGVDAWSPPASKAAARCARHLPLVISVSDLTLERFLGWCPVSRKATALVPNSVRLDGFGPGAKNPELVRRLGLDRRKVVMTLGRMSPLERYKGFDEVIELIPRLREREPSICYLAAGEGADRPRLEAKARDLGVRDHVVFTGSVAEHEKADHFRLADAFVMASSGEGFGIVVLEALACGVPVVASIADGTREAVRNGELGLLADPADPAALERAVLEAIRRPKHVPAGLAWYSFASFAERLQLALSRVVAI